MKCAFGFPLLLVCYKSLITSCFDILVGIRMEKEIYSGFYVKMKSRGAINAPNLTKPQKIILAPLWKYEYFSIISHRTWLIYIY